jgi:hypothetical protein
MVAESQPIKYPAKTKRNTFISGPLLIFHLISSMIAHTKKIAMLHVAHAEYDLFICLLYAVKKLSL